MTINGSAINEEAALDEEAYQLWLRDPSAAVAHLVWIDYNGTSAVYPNWVKYTLKTSDLPFADHRDRVKSIGSFSRKIGDRFSGVTSASIGNIDFDNPDGELDSWHKLSVDGQRVKVLHGDPSWDVSRFRTVYECVAEGFVSSDSTTLSLRLRTVEYLYNLPVQQNLVGNTTVNSSANVPIPKAWGQVFNVEPELVDSTNLIYQWNDGAVTSVSDVRDGGVPFQTSQIAISAVSGNTISTATAHGFYAGTRVRCDVGSLPVASSWSNIAWNGAVFCAVAYGSTIAATSPDGITWTQRVLPASADWNGVAWNGTVFCAMAINDSVAATSPDGITWTQRVLPVSATWRAIAWNGAVFCIIAASGTIAATSSDGITWTQRVLPASATWIALAWNGTVFGAIAISGTIAATSPDGITWTQRVLPASADWYSIAWNGTVFCAIATGGTIAATSPDGITWTQQVLPVSASWRGMAWNGTVFCAVALGSSIAATSPDGITWTQQVLPVSASWYSIAWNGTMFCAIALSSAYATLSNDGITWSSVTNTLPAPLAPQTDYWVIADGLTSTAFKLSATRGGTIITLTNTTAGAVLLGRHWTADLTTGKVLMASNSAGKITLDGVVSVGSTTLGSTAADLVVAVLGAVNVDNRSYVAFESICDQIMGVYVKNRENRLTIANNVMAGIGAWYGYGRDGMLRFGRVEGNQTSYNFTLTADDFITVPHIDQIVPPEKKHRIGYRRNWTNQSGALFAAVSADSRELYSRDNSVTQPQTSTDVGANGSFHVTAIVPDVQDSLMYYGSDALAEAQRLDAMYFGWGAVFACEVGRIGTLIDAGDVVNVTYSRFGLSGGVNMTCISVDDNPTAGSTALRFFVALGNYTPGQL